MFKRSPTYSLGDIQQQLKQKDEPQQINLQQFQHQITNQIIQQTTQIPFQTNSSSNLCQKRNIITVNKNNTHSNKIINQKQIESSDRTLYTQIFQAKQLAYLSTLIIQFIQTHKRNIHWQQSHLKQQILISKSLTEQIMQIINNTNISESSKFQMKQTFQSGVDKQEEENQDRIYDSIKGIDQKLIFHPMFIISKQIFETILTNQKTNLIQGFSGISKTYNICFFKRLNNFIIKYALLSQTYYEYLSKYPELQIDIKKINNQQHYSVSKIIYYSVNLQDTIQQIQSFIINQIKRDYSDYDNEIILKWIKNDKQHCPNLYLLKNSKIKIRVILIIDQINILGQVCKIKNQLHQFFNKQNQNKHQILNQQYKKTILEEKIWDKFGKSLDQINTLTTKLIKIKQLFKSLSKVFRKIIYFSSINMQQKIIKSLQLFREKNETSIIRQYIHFLQQYKTTQFKLDIIDYFNFEIRTTISDKLQKINQSKINQINIKYKQYLNRKKLLKRLLINQNTIIQSNVKSKKLLQFGQQRILHINEISRQENNVNKKKFQTNQKTYQKINNDKSVKLSQDTSSIHYQLNQSLWNQCLAISNRNSLYYSQKYSKNQSDLPKKGSHKNQNNIQIDSIKQRNNKSQKTKQKTSFSQKLNNKKQQILKYQSIRRSERIMNKTKILQNNNSQYKYKKQQITTQKCQQINYKSQNIQNTKIITNDNDSIRTTLEKYSFNKINKQMYKKYNQIISQNNKNNKNNNNNKNKNNNNNKKNNNNNNNNKNNNNNNNKNQQIKQNNNKSQKFLIHYDKCIRQSRLVQCHHIQQQKDNLNSTIKSISLNIQNTINKVPQIINNQKSAINIFDDNNNNKIQLQNNNDSFNKDNSQANRDNYQRQKTKPNKYVQQQKLLQQIKQIKKYNYNEFKYNSNKKIQSHIISQQNKNILIHNNNQILINGNNQILINGNHQTQIKSNHQTQVKSNHQIQVKSNHQIQTKNYMKNNNIIYNQVNENYHSIKEIQILIKDILQQQKLNMLKWFNNQYLFLTPLSIRKSLKKYLSTYKGIDQFPFYILFQLTQFLNYAWIQSFKQLKQSVKKFLTKSLSSQTKVHLTLRLYYDARYLIKYQQKLQNKHFNINYHSSTLNKSKISTNNIKYNQYLSNSLKQSYKIINQPSLINQSSQIYQQSYDNQQLQIDQMNINNHTNQLFKQLLSKRKGVVQCKQIIINEEQAILKSLQSEVDRRLFTFQYARNQGTFKCLLPANVTVQILKYVITQQKLTQIDIHDELKFVQSLRGGGYGQYLKDKVLEILKQQGTTLQIIMFNNKNNQMKRTHHMSGKIFTFHPLFKQRRQIQPNKQKQINRYCLAKQLKKYIPFLQMSYNKSLLLVPLNINNIQNKDNIIYINNLQYDLNLRCTNNACIDFIITKITTEQKLNTLNVQAYDFTTDKNSIPTKIYNFIINYKKYWRKSYKYLKNFHNQTKHILKLSYFVLLPQGIYEQANNSSIKPLNQKIQEKLSNIQQLKLECLGSNFYKVRTSQDEQELLKYVGAVGLDNNKIHNTKIDIINKKRVLQVIRNKKEQQKGIIFRSQ